jgi:predicted nucleic acid-binding protein
MAHGLGVATLNRHEFERVPGLRLIEPLDEVLNGIP